MKGTKAANNVHAKTGSLGGVSSLSGYVKGTNGDLYVFSLIMNNYPGSDADAHAAQDKFAVALASDALTGRTTAAPPPNKDGD